MISSNSNTSSSSSRSSSSSSSSNSNISLFRHSLCLFTLGINVLIQFYAFVLANVQHCHNEILHLTLIKFHIKHLNYNFQQHALTWIRDDTCKIFSHDRNFFILTFIFLVCFYVFNNLKKIQLQHNSFRK